MTYKVITEYKHDDNAYTQGLEFYNNQLYESSGLNGKSTLRKSDYKSGEILNIVNLDYEYFGEGLTVINDKIYQLTWKNNIGIIYDLDFNKIGTFDYGKVKRDGVYAMMEVLSINQMEQIKFGFWIQRLFRK